MLCFRKCCTTSIFALHTLTVATSYIKPSIYAYIVYTLDSVIHYSITKLLVKIYFYVNNILLTFYVVYIVLRIYNKQ